MQRRSVFLVSSVLGLAACGGGTESGGPRSSTSIPLDQLAEPLTTVVCEYFARCVPLAAEDQFPGGCYAYELPRVANGTIPQLQELVRTGRVAYDPERMPACLEAYRTFSCGTSEAELADCRAALHGTVAIGGACRLQQECAGNARCDTSTSCPGVCAARGSAGASCDSSLDCASDLTCSLSKGACVARATQGEACGGPDDIPCLAPLACVGDTGTELGKCQDYTHGDAGAACDWNQGNLCKAGLACVATGKAADGAEVRNCVAKSAPGGSCNVGLQDSCPTGQYCPLTATDRINGVFSATCKPYGAPGTECSTSSTYACGTQGNCSTDAHCVALGKVGDACKEDGDCLTNRCTAGACAIDLGCE